MASLNEFMAKKLICWQLNVVSYTNTFLSITLKLNESLLQLIITTFDCTLEVNKMCIKNFRS
jgi:hypothetical protein